MSLYDTLYKSMRHSYIFCKDTYRCSATALHNSTDTTEVYATLIHVLQRHIYMFCNDSIEFYYRLCRSLYDTPYMFCKHMYTRSAKTRTHVLQRHYDTVEVYTTLIHVLQRHYDTVEVYTTLIHVLQRHSYMFCKDTTTL